MFRVAADCCLALLNQLVPVMIVVVDDYPYWFFYDWPNYVDCEKFIVECLRFDDIEMKTREYILNYVPTMI